jgi:hypothetical protein
MPTVSDLSPLAFAACAHALCWLLHERVAAVWKSAKVDPSTAKGVLLLPVWVIWFGQHPLLNQGRLSMQRDIRDLLQRRRGRP